MFNIVSSTSDNAASSFNFDHALSSLQNHFAEVTSRKERLFTVDTDGLWDLYLSVFPGHARQEHNCNCCKQFIKNYGGLVYISEKGTIVSAIWGGDKSGDFSHVFKSLNDEVVRRKVESEFFVDHTKMGTSAKTLYWNHFHVIMPKKLINSDRVYSASQLMAKSKVSKQALTNGVNRYPLDIVNKTISLLQNPNMVYGDKILPMAEWFQTLLKRIADKKGNVRDNLIWKFSAENPSVSSINSSAMSTVMDDIKDGLYFEEIRKKFLNTMDPLRYRRPQEDPRSQNVKRGEILIEKLGFKSSLARRSATIDDLDTIWQPSIKKTSQGASTGVFGDIKVREPKGKDEVHSSAPSIKMSFAKFQRTVLNKASKIQVYVGYKVMPYYFTTAVDKNAPCIIKSGSHEAGYQYTVPTQKSMVVPSSLNYIDVTGILYHPLYKENPSDAFFLLSGAKEFNDPGMALFPEILVSSLHEVRRTIEAYSNANKLTKVSDPAVALPIGKAGLDLKVTIDGVVSSYTIDRFE